MDFIQNITLLSPDDTLLLVVDVQEKLAPAMLYRESSVKNTRKLIETAKLFRLPVLVTEQYPQGLGHTLDEIQAVLPEDCPTFQKKGFSVCLSESVMKYFEENPKIQKILLCGWETHVCIHQSALDLLSVGFQVNVAVDAVSSRFEKDYDFGLRRMEASGVFLCTAEAAIFELCRTADAPEFKTISRLVR